jgi:protein-S-isoprenylcysteine O-methyltransferase Ste14
MRSSAGLPPYDRDRDGEGTGGWPSSPDERRVGVVSVHLVDVFARRRVTLGFLAGALALWFAQPTISSVVRGTLVALTGEALRVWASGHLNKAREVTSSGPYRWLSHPLYVGSAIMGVGLALAANSYIVTAIIAAYLGVTLTAAIRKEEAFLQRTFGDRYIRYRRGLPQDARDAPGPRDERRFSVAQAIANREYRAIAGLAVAVLLLSLKATYNGGSLWPIAAG